MIDLRSDTVTRPTEEMRRAMASAEVGDDVYQEDPTVNRLEARAAEITGKEAALFVPSGTMGNTIAIKLHTRHGQEVICESRCHIFNYELAMMSWFAGCLARPLSTPDGILRWEQIAAAIKPLGPHWAPTGLIEVENTHNMGGGTVYPIYTLKEIYEKSGEHGLPVHMDGARVFNAAAYLDVRVADIARYADTMMFCLSKALGAPVGSMLAGPRALIDEGRLYRKRLGGGMRQAGVLAAAGLIALEQMPERLHEDHANARYLAEGLANVRGIRIDPDRVVTNIVIFNIEGTGFDSRTLSRRLLERGVLSNGVNATEMRMVTHHDVTHSMCEQVLTQMEAICSHSAAAR